jgi:hypothetical protein
MPKLFRVALAAALFGALSPRAALSEGEAEPTPFPPEQLEQLVAPIALHPDALVAQILMAATYPLEVVEADRFMRKNEKLKGAELEKALMEKEWDASVKSLCTMPDVLKQMSENLDWTQDLGDAFLAQKKEVLDAVQRMRANAKEAGHLESTNQQTVTVENEIIVIESSDPEVIYVPTYSPVVVYTSPPPAPYYPAVYSPPGYGLLAFGAGMAVGAACWGDCDWGGGDVNIDIDKHNEFNRNTNRNSERTNVKSGGGKQGQWKHDSSHRKGVGYRDSNTAKQHGGSGASSRVSRDQARGRDSGASASGKSARTPSSGDRGASGASSKSGSSTGGRGTANSGSRDPGGDRAASSRGSSSRSSYSGSKRSSGGGSGSRSGGGSRGGGGGGGRR